MREGSGVLMVCGGEGSNLSLRKVLNDAGIHVRIARSCAEARLALGDLNVAQVLFSDTTLPDGTWTDVVSLAAEQKRRVPVVVVSRVVDINLYITALEKGAYDFIVPPFYHQDVLHVLKCAAVGTLAAA